MVSENEFNLDAAPHVVYAPMLAGDTRASLQHVHTDFGPVSDVDV